MTSAPPLSVLLVGNFLGAGGGSRSICEELALRLPRTNCTVWTTSAKKGRLMRLADMLTTVWRRRRQYGVAQVDVFSGKAFFWAEAVCAELALVGKPYILSLHGGNLPAFAERRRTRVRRLLRSATAVTTPSRYLQKSFSEHLDDIRFIPNGLDLPTYQPRERTPVGPRLVWIRAFHSIYNPSLAIEMLPRVAARYPNVHLTMIGPDKGDGSLQAAERRAAALGVRQHVEFRGGVPKRDVPQMLRTGDIFLNSTNVDSAPVTVLEAMACGLCVVTTNVGGLPYLADHERDALLVPPNDPAAMSDAVLRLLGDPALADRLSRSARSKAERFDWTPIVDDWRALLASTAAKAS